MKCREGHECVKAPFTKGYYYCKICQPREHRMHEDNKKHRIAMMQSGKKLKPRKTILDEVLEGFK